MNIRVSVLFLISEYTQYSKYLKSRLKSVQAAVNVHKILGGGGTHPTTVGTERPSIGIANILIHYSL